MVASADVVIAGAGPAGAAAAIAAARRGLEVLLIDRARFPRDKACGEGLMPSALEALARLRLLGRVRAMGQPLEAIGIQLGGEEGARGAIEALGVERIKLDALLVETARSEAGVTLLEGVQAIAPLKTGDRVVGLHTSLGPLRGRHLICADGLRSSLRAQLNLDEPSRRRSRIGLRKHYEVPRLPFGRAVQVILERELELYLTPVGPSRLQIAALGESSAFETLGLSATTFDDHMRRRFGDLCPVGGRALGAGPFEQHARRVVAEGALLCGDAAGYLDAITGEGVGLALQEGLAAADAVASGDLDAYADAHREITRDADRLTRLVLFVSEHPWLARRAIAALRNHPEWFARLLSVQAGGRLDLPLRLETYLRILISR
jgi:flavin-dependent dehydrogenase